MKNPKLGYVNCDSKSCQQLKLRQIEHINQPGPMDYFTMPLLSRCIALITLFALIALTNSTAAQIEQVPNVKNQKPAQFKSPCVIQFHGEINWQLAKYFRSRVSQAKSAGHDLIVINIDSPGGLKSESLDLAELVRDIDWAYTVGFVPREALSGAALLTLGCDELIVAEFGRLGDIGVIQFDPQLFAFRFAEEKITSKFIPQARVLATSKGRSPELAEAMIDKDYHVYELRTGDVVEFRGQKSVDPALDGDWQLVPETKKGFLTVNGVRAKQLGLASGNAKDLEGVAQQIGFDLNNTRVIRHTSTDSIVYWLSLIHI